MNRDNPVLIELELLTVLVFHTQSYHPAATAIKLTPEGKCAYCESNKKLVEGR